VNVIVEQALLFFTAQNVFAPGFPKKNFGVKLVTLFDKFIHLSENCESCKQKKKEKI
jgi:hypothetical protein